MVSDTTGFRVSPEAAIHAVRLALDFRCEFARDAVVELICYRRYGHNEGDEPYFTQPLMYEKIKSRPPVHDFYGKRLMEEGLPEEELRKLTDEIAALLNSAGKREGSVSGNAFLGRWSGIQREYSSTKIETGLARATLLSLAGSLSELPPDFTPHPKIAALLQKRRAATVSGEGIDWAMASRSWCSRRGFPRSPVGRWWTWWTPGKSRPRPSRDSSVGPAPPSSRRRSGQRPNAFASWRPAATASRPSRGKRRRFSLARSSGCCVRAGFR